MIQAPISLGELYDKISILEIKLSVMSDEEKLNNVKKEYIALVNLSQYIDIELYEELQTVNKDLWIIEDKIRLKEKEQEFDEDFILLARSVYKLNDKRAEIKKQINLKYESGIIEEKSYQKYE